MNYNINETFIIESQGNDTPIISACTAIFTSNILSCSGGTEISLGDVIILGGDVQTNSISATTYFGDGSHLSGITTSDTYVTGGTYNSSTGIATFTNNTGGTFSINGFYTNANDIYVTGGTYSNGTATFKNNTGGTFNVSGFYTGYTAPIDVFITGGTYSNGTATFTNNTGGTFNVSGFKTNDVFVTGGTKSNSNVTFTNNTGGTFTVTGFSDTFVTGGTYSNGTASFTNNTGGTFNISGFFKVSDDIYSTGLTFNQGNYNLVLTRNDGASLTTNLGALSSDVTITGGTYNPLTGIATFTNNTGGTFNVSGFLTGYTDIHVTALTYNNNVITVGSSDGSSYSASINTMTGLTATTISATTYQNLPKDIYTTGGTYTSGTATFTNNTGGTFNVSGFAIQGITGLTGGANISITGSNNSYTVSFTGTTGSNFTGGTVTGATSFTNGLTANTISATTYQNLPLDIRVTGGTYSNGTATFTNNTGGTFSVTGFSTGGGSFTGGTVSGATQFTGGLTATTISATTYQNLPLDIRVTGVTYSNNTFTFTNNTGGTFNVNFNILSGLTVNGALTVTGNSSLNGGISSTSFSGTTSRLVQSDTSGNLSAGVNVVSAYISSASTAATLITTTSNWDIDGNYIGSSITGTSMGQKYYDNNYFYEAVLDNSWIRLIRG
jgi:hypothetical protein